MSLGRYRPQGQAQQKIVGLLDGIFGLSQGAQVPLDHLAAGQRG